jgi:signal recognition particle subunit SRP19
MGIRHVVQPYKGYSRDVDSQWDNLGRVLVDLEEPIPEVYDVDDLPEMGDGKQSKKKLMREISKRIPSLPGRIRRLEEEKRALEEAKAKEAAAHKAISQKASTTSGGHAKKKGKKKR